MLKENWPPGVLVVAEMILKEGEAVNRGFWTWV